MCDTEQNLLVKAFCISYLTFNKKTYEETRKVLRYQEAIKRNRLIIAEIDARLEVFNGIKQDFKNRLVVDGLEYREYDFKEKRYILEEEIKYFLKQIAKLRFSMLVYDEYIKTENRLRLMDGI